ncbi:MAG TPA: hypothetical protein VFF04_06955 [Candidatus Babeliales bacterium]|nr:hypothetical protein [Candidatus Babeliales bacterium]
MAINVFIVKEDFRIIIKKMDRIDVDDNFFKLREIANQEQCIFISTLDDIGATLINELQLDEFKEEIQKLSKRLDVDQKKLNQLKSIADAVDTRGCQYIKFIGE